MFAVLLAGLSAPFGTTILGWIAVTQIRHSAGKLYGMWLAVCAGLLFPLLALDAVMVFVYALVVSALRLLSFSPAMGLVVKIAAVVLGLLFLALTVCLDIFIIRRVWRAVNRTHVLPAATPPPTSDRFWRKLVLALILVPLGLLLAAALMMVLVYLSFDATRSSERHMAASGVSSILDQPEDAATSVLNIKTNSQGEMIVEARNVRLVHLVDSVFRDLPLIDKSASHSVSVTGNGMGLNKKVSGRLTGHNQAEFLAQLQTIGSCVITVTTDGTREVVTLATRPESLGPPPSPQPVER
jgi:hypothetical protein